MFGLTLIAKSKVDFLNLQIEDLENTVTELRKARDKDFTDAKNKLFEDVIDEPIGIDFETINAFSIERIPNYAFDNKMLESTVIGYLLPGQTEPREWFFYCSKEKHKQLVAAFATYVKTKK